MLHRASRFWYKLAALFLALALIVPVLAACGKGKETTLPTATASPVTTPTATPSMTATPTAMPTSVATSTPTPTGPVKIGAICAWSGPAAPSGILADQMITLVEDQVKNQGGILGGRMVDFIRGDSRGMVSEASAQARKLIQEDKVTILTLGGESGAESTAVADVVEELKVPFAAFTTVDNVEARKYSVALYGFSPAINAGVGFINDMVKPKTVAFLALDTAPNHTVIEGIRTGVEAKGATTVYEQYYSMDTIDFSPYLTKIKYLKPDLLVSHTLMGDAISIVKQMLELGGWGGTTYYAASPAAASPSVVKVPATVGSYVAVLWLPDSDEPGMKAFGDAFKQEYGRLPSTDLAFYYNSFWTAIKAIELANSDDPIKVAQVLRSGNLEWDSAYGPMLIPTTGQAAINEMVAQVQAGSKLVKVWPQ
jgi:branched-chain amino acid transport system substrate-binding protein